MNILSKSSNNSSNEISKKEILNTIECENSKFEEQKKMRDTAWQQFGAEYNENGEFIGTPRNTDYTFWHLTTFNAVKHAGCGKEPVSGHDGYIWDGEKRDRSGAFWQVNIFCPVRPYLINANTLSVPQGNTK